MKLKKSLSRRVYEVMNVVLLILFSIVCIYPILNQVALSFSSSSGILKHTVSILPIDFTLETYQGILREKTFWMNYSNTLLYTVLGTGISLFMTTICAYPLSKKYLYGGSVILKFFVFTMFFGGGLIPTYMLIRNLHMIDTIWAIVVPGAIAPFSILLMKTYFEGLPSDLEDAAAIDGLSQWGCFLRIALPLSKPIIATMTLFSAVGYWNEWFSAVLYLNDSDKYPVTLYLRNIMMGAQIAAANGHKVDVSATVSIPQSIQAAAMLIVTVPILCVYPFVQKHFAKGVMIGAIKG